MSPALVPPFKRGWATCPAPGSPNLPPCWLRPSLAPATCRGRHLAANDRASCLRSDRLACLPTLPAPGSQALGRTIKATERENTKKRRVCLQQTRHRAHSGDQDMTSDLTKTMLQMSAGETANKQIK